LKKRLETVDGVEIASSYKEYLDLALGDLEDRLNKSNLKLADVESRSDKRMTLIQEIDKEVLLRQAYTRSLSKKDKLLRARLLRNTEMKSAMENLAVIAGYKLHSGEARNQQQESDAYADSLERSSHDDNLTDFESISDQSSASELKANLTNVLVEQLAKSKNSSSYTRYIQLAYDEIDALLTNDKQTLIDIIRHLKTNEAKLKELDHLKEKANASLTKLSEYKVYLKTMITHDSQITQTVKQLERQMDNVRKVSQESGGLVKNVLESQN
jgi:hypothetical protein